MSGIVSFAGTATNRSQSLFRWQCCSVVLFFLVGCTSNSEDPQNTPKSQPTSTESSLPKKALRPRTAEARTTPGAAPAFQDVASKLGLKFAFHSDTVEGRFFLPEVMGGGVGVIDVDRDGWMDLFYPNGTHLIPSESQKASEPRDALFLSRRGQNFSECAGVAGVDAGQYGQGSAVADYDADGFADLFVSNYGLNVLYRNNGDGSFSEQRSSIVRGSQLWGSSCAWVDVNHDGWIDLYVVNYLGVTAKNIRTCDYFGITGYCGPGEFDALPDQVFLNLADGEFRDVTSELGFIAENGKGLAVSVLDFNDDLKAEIYVANDMTANFLFSQTMPGSGAVDASSDGLQYREVAAFSGCAVSEAGMHEASMGVACADFDCDSRPDIYLTHFYHQKNTLYHNRDNLTFVDDSRRFRVVTASLDYNGFGVVPLDFDQNGTMDLFIANGHVLGLKYTPNEMLPQLLMNVDGKHFEDISAVSGNYFRQPNLGRGAAGIDFDNDGDPDVSISHVVRPVSLLRNDTVSQSRGVIGLLLEDHSRNSPVGGRVEIVCGDYKRVYPVVSGGSYLSSPDPRMVIPVPLSFTQAPQLRVFWPSGMVTEYSQLKEGSYWYLREGNAPIPLADSSFPAGNAAIRR